MTMTELPFFHAETVGSLLHPDELIAAQERFDRAEITAEALREVEDRAIVAAIDMQQRVGLPVATDGELRRRTYIDFVLTGLTGLRMEWRVPEKSLYRDAAGEEAATPRPEIVVFDRIRHAGSTSAADAFGFLAAHSGVTAKATIPGPPLVHFFSGRDGINREIYPRLDDFWSDLADAYVTELDMLRAAGCQYVQFDETSLIKLVDPSIRQWISERGDDPDVLIETYVDVLAAIVGRAPKDMRVGIHLCRGNNRGTWQADGGYDLIARLMFTRLPVDVYVLEYDTPRAGSFEPLRHVPDDKHVVLGLLSTKLREAEDAGAIAQRIREAGNIVPLDRLGVSPQCGFWGGINLCTPAEMENKLRRVVEIADEIWGG